MQDTLTVTEAAKELGVHRTTVWRLVKSGELVAYRIGGRWLLQRADVVAYIERARNVPREGGEHDSPSTDR